MMQTRKTKYLIEELDGLVCRLGRCDEAIATIKSGEKCTVRISDPEVICLDDAVKGEIIPLIEKHQNYLRAEIAAKQDEIRKLIGGKPFVPDCPDPPKPPDTKPKYKRAKVRETEDGLCILFYGDEWIGNTSNN